MNLSATALVFLWSGVSIYALLGGADFGAGFWDLVAGGPRRGAPVRARIEKSIGPVWEANHVWLIFALVVMWTAFPPAFAAVAATLYIPLSAAAFGIILRGSGFAFRKEITTLRFRRALGASFAFSSVVTPFALGSVAGAVASGRVPLALGAGSVITSWLNPTSMLFGALAVAVTAYIAAVFLCADCERHGDAVLVAYFRRRAMITAAAVGIAGATGVAVVHADAPALFHGLETHAAPVLGLSVACGLGSILLLWRRHFVLVRLSASLAILTAIAGWGIAQYPDILEPTVTADQVASAPQVLQALLGGLTVGGLLVIPSLVILFRLSQRSDPDSAAR